MKTLIILGVFVTLAFARPADEGQKILQLATQLGATTLVELVDKVGLTSALSGEGPFTVFAPTNDAFAAVPQHILDYLESHPTELQALLKFHVVAGEVKSTDIKNEETVATLEGAKLRTNIYNHGKVITVDGSPVTAADKMATNGVIHVISKVMFPIPMTSVVETAKDLPMFSTLVTALEKADLVDALEGDGPFTVFAPTNEAFSKIPPHELERILENKPLLTAILTYHVVGSTQYSAGLKNGERVPTLEGNTLTVHINGEEVLINNARVEVPNIPVTNGVIHVIDRVLIPTPPPRKVR